MKKTAALLTCIATAAIWSSPVFAAESIIATLEEEQDLTIIFNYDEEKPEISFLSEDGEIDAETVLKSEGTGWSVYEIEDAAPGNWYVSYDLEENTQIEYSVLSSRLGISILYFEADLTETESASFSAISSLDGVPYSYDIYAVNTETGGYYALVDGEAESSEDVAIDLNPSLMTDGIYYLELEVYIENDDNEAYDTMTSNTFLYSKEEGTEEYEETIEAGTIVSGSVDDETSYEDNTEVLAETEVLTAEENEENESSEEKEEIIQTDSPGMNTYILISILVGAIVLGGEIFLLRNED